MIEFNIGKTKVTIYNPIKEIYVFMKETLKFIGAVIAIITVPIWYPIAWFVCSVGYWWACFDYWFFQKFRNPYNDKYFCKRKGHR